MQNNKQTKQNKNIRYNNVKPTYYIIANMEGFFNLFIWFANQHTYLYTSSQRLSGPLPIGLKKKKIETLPRWRISLLMWGASSFAKKVTFLLLVHVSRKMMVRRGFGTLLARLSSTRMGVLWGFPPSMRDPL